MAKIKTTAILDEVYTSSDKVNWNHQGSHDFEISTLLQENGDEAVVTIPESVAGKQLSIKEMRELLKAMEVCDRAIEG